MSSVRAIGLLVLSASSAFSTAITWNVNMLLDDGATVTGSFVFDPDLPPPANPTGFNISISAATPGILTEPLDDGLPTSTFFPFDFTPANSVAFGEEHFQNEDFQDTSLFLFESDVAFPDPLNFPSPLIFGFDLPSPLTDSTNTTLTNANVDVNFNRSFGECFDCVPRTCFAGASSSATGGLCADSAAQTPEPGSLGLVAFGGCTLIFLVQRRGFRKLKPGSSVNGRTGWYWYRHLDKTSPHG